MRAPRWAIAYISFVVAAVIAAGLLRIEAWPLTGWRLFSYVRIDNQKSWQAVLVEGGSEHEIPFGQMSAAYAGHVHVLNGFPKMAPPERAAVCAAWAGALRELDREAEEIRIYRIEWRLSERMGSRAAAPHLRVLTHVCKPLDGIWVASSPR